MKTLQLNEMESIEGGISWAAFGCGLSVGIGFAVAGPFGAAVGVVAGCYALDLN